MAPGPVDWGDVCPFKHKKTPTVVGVFTHRARILGKRGFSL